jgi:hypothetical protein
MQFANGFTWTGYESAGPSPDDFSFPLVRSGDACLRVRAWTFPACGGDFNLQGMIGLANPRGWGVESWPGHTTS